jgi:hypothetical protein
MGRALASFAGTRLLPVCREAQASSERRVAVGTAVYWATGCSADVMVHLRNEYTLADGERRAEWR